jgi:voltage-gated potassium channel
MERKYSRQLLFALFLIVVIMGSGAAFFMVVEGWSITNSFYFTGITLLTIGYGDMVPTSMLSKVATVIFGFLGIFYTAVLTGSVEYSR